MIYTDISDKTDAVGAYQDLSFSMTGAPGDDFAIGVGIAGPYPVWGCSPYDGSS